MSTTVKPLNIYIGDTKVFPDVDLSTVGDSFYTNDAITEMKEASDEFMASDRSDVSQYMSGKTFICQNFDDSDSSSRHTHDYCWQDYWLFADAASVTPTILDIDFDINAKWLWNSIGTTNGYSAFRGLKNITKLNFKSTEKMRPAGALDQNDHSIVLFSYLPLTSLFDGCNQLEEINGLDLTSTQSFANSIDPSNDGTLVYNPVTKETHWISDYENNTLLGNCASTFSNCQKLTTLGITWPNTLYTCNTERMFEYCYSLPDNQIPTFNLAPIYIPYTTPDGEGRTYAGSPTININFMFHDCANVTSTHLSAETWAYIKTTSCTWQGTQVRSIDIPATATNLINVGQIIGGPVGVDNGQGGTDFSNCKYIIRTTAPMTAKLNSVDGNDCLLFNFWDYDGNTDFINTFGGIYVPDEQLTDWQNAITNEWGGSSIAQNCVHGLSEL